METPLALTVGVLFACGLYLVMQRNLLRFVFGLLLLSGSVNLLIFTVGRLTRGAPAFVPSELSTPPGDVSNALPQALILTAIVIGFGLVVFAMILLLRTYERLGTVKTEELSAHLEAPRPVPMRHDDEAPA
ncbi:Na+/H+ antiporter subunit C [soil metagenome]|nr:NADH-quinone oxidoreductase subunit K [Trueperaceae bacterium]